MDVNPYSFFLKQQSLQQKSTFSNYLSAIFKKKNLTLPTK